jgi:hypothetical protein
LRLEETMSPASRDSVIHTHDRREHPAAGPASPLTKACDAGPAETEPRSSFGALPGAEFPSFVYVSVVAAFAWVMIASWLAFAQDMDAALSLGIAIVLGIVFFALPIIIRHIARVVTRDKPDAAGDLPGDFLTAPVDTATGPLPGASAWLQVLIIPLTLALAATLIGAASLLVR